MCLTVKNVNNTAVFAQVHCQILLQNFGILVLRWIDSESVGWCDVFHVIVVLVGSYELAVAILSISL